MKTQYLKPAAAVLSVACLTACAKTPDADSTAGFRESFTEPIEAAHNRTAWDSRDSVAMDIEVVFGGKTRIDGRMTMKTDNSQIRIDQNNGDVLVFDGVQAWVSPTASEQQGARFHLLTWPYFLSAPFKLNDPGTYVTDHGPSTIFGEPYSLTAKLTFGGGVGDAPDDWYILYRNPETDVLDAMGYIVTYRKPQAEAEEDPHAIIYKDYRVIDGVPIPHQWDFTYYTHEKGVHGEHYGGVSVSNVEFLDADPSLYVKPSNAREDKLPGG